MRHLIKVVLSLVLLAQLAIAHGASLQEQRRYYDQAKAALARNNAQVFYQYAAELASYPLTPYLTYADINNRINTVDNQEVERFLSEHGDLPPINWLKLRWLRLLAQRGEWATFNRYYSPDLGFAELDCLYGQYQLTHNMERQGAQTAERLWLVGKSQPAACDATFELWAADGGLTETMRWKRVKLAVEARNFGLARSLAADLTTLQRQAALLQQVAKNPRLLEDPSRFQPADAAMADAVGLGLRRLARQDPEQALSLLGGYSQSMRFPQQERVAIAREIGLTLAKKFDPRALSIMAEYDPQLRDDDVSAWRARLLLRLGRWQQAYQLIQKMPPSLSQTSRWRYWLARSFSLANPNDKAKAHQLFARDAKERDFYGFLSAEQIDEPYNLTSKPIAPLPSVLTRVRKSPGIVRALEFDAKGDEVNARREWYHASNYFNQQEMAVQARLAYNMGWYFPAIHTLNKAEYWDDLEVRFPTPYRNIIQREARAQDIDETWIYAITRQESSFMADARSGSGALGLMQLMPATARETARKLGMRLTNIANLTEPSYNIKLGAAYLSQMYDRFNSSRVLASAAYNAGPGRVSQWLADTRHLPFDVWVENIPFDETRKYVQNVLSYAVIYGQKLNEPQTVAEWQERFFGDL